MNYKEMLDAVWQAQSVKNIEVREPKPGLRHNKETKHVRHRFPVKGGISNVEDMQRLVSASCPLFALVRDGKL